MSEAIQNLKWLQSAAVDPSLKMAAQIAIDYLSGLDRLMADMGCDCSTCRVIVAALPPVYVLDDTTCIVNSRKIKSFEIREHANVQLVACSETLPPLTFDAERGWQARSHN